MGVSRNWNRFNRAIVLATTMGLTLACGEDSNINKFLFTKKGDDESVRSLVAKAQLAYDRKEYDRAQELAEAALDVNPGNEKAGIILAYVYLGRVGVAPFELTRSVICREDGKDENCEDIEDTETSEESTDESAEGSANTAAGAVGALDYLVNISADDLRAMTEVREPDPDHLKWFSGIDVYVPKNPGQYSDAGSPRQVVPTLFNLNKALEVICPFVSTSVLSVEDPRHEGCGDSNGGLIRARAQSHFLWAIGHMLEGIIFNAVILFDGVEIAGNQINLTATEESKGGVADQSTLAKRVQGLNGATVGDGDIPNYVGAVKNVQSLVGEIFKAQEPEEPVTSMFSYTLENLRTVSSTFKAIPGVPDTLTAKIDTALDSLKKAAEKIGADSNSSSGQSKALQGQMNKKVAENLKKSVDKFFNGKEAEDLASENPALYAEKQAELCGAYDDIATGVEGVARPEGCEGVPEE